MSAPWIKLDTGFMQHPKTAEVLDQRGGPQAIVGLLSVWCWAGGSDTTEAREGHVTDAMLRRLGVTKSQAALLSGAGFLDRNGNGYHIRGWDEYQGALIDRRAKDADRKARNRAKGQQP